MTAYLGLLRAVNVGGSGPIGMEALRRSLEALGLRDVRTLLASGNVVFRSDESDRRRLEARMEARTAQDFGYPTDYFVRSGAEWAELVRSNPFTREGKEDPARLVVTVLKDAPNEAQWKALAAAVAGRERVRPGARHAYITYPDGQGRSKLTIAVIERHLATRGTSRNWNTVTKLAALLRDLG